MRVISWFYWNFTVFEQYYKKSENPSVFSRKHILNLKNRFYDDKLEIKFSYKLRKPILYTAIEKKEIQLESLNHNFNKMIQYIYKDIMDLKKKI